MIQCRAIPGWWFWGSGRRGGGVVGDGEVEAEDDLMTKKVFRQSCSYEREIRVEKPKKISHHENGWGDQKGITRAGQ